jgi:hypothetical protein
VAVADTKSSIVVKKQADYRGLSKIWSNRYHFDGDLPPDPVHWNAFMDAVVDAEKLILPATVEIVQVVGYDAATASSTNPHGDAVYSRDYTTVGTFAPAVGDVGCPGDCAALIRYGTPVRSVKNHPVYLMNYYHGCFNTTTDGDHLAADQLAAMQTYGTAWITGFSDGTETHHRVGPRGAVATSRRVDPYIRHRDFPS